MFPTKTLLTVTTILSLPLSAAAQFTLPQINPGITFTRVLPSYESRFGDYEGSIGNSWLGGSVQAYAGMVRQQQGTYQLGNQSVELSATGTLLKRSARVLDVTGTASNVINNGTQTRSGQFRVDIIGKTVLNKTINGSVNLGSSNTTYNLFPSPISGDVPLLWGVSISVAGNAGCGFGRSVNWTLPVGVADVGLGASANAYAMADAWLGIGIPKVASAGVGIKGKVLNQTLSVNATASAASGLSGSATYSLTPISIALYVYGELFGARKTNTVTSWSAGSVSKTLM